jgi:hypothetical protein
MIISSVNRYASDRVIFYLHEYCIPCHTVCWCFTWIFALNAHQMWKRQRFLYARREVYGGRWGTAPLLTTKSGTELFCIWFKFDIILLLRLGLLSAFFPYYTVSIDYVFATFTSAGTGHSFALKGMVGFLVTNWRTDEQNCVIKVVQGGTLKSLWFPCERYHIGLG